MPNRSEANDYICAHRCAARRFLAGSKMGAAIEGVSWELMESLTQERCAEILKNAEELQKWIRQKL